MVGNQIVKYSYYYIVVWN